MKETLGAIPSCVQVEKLLGDAGYDSEENHRRAQGTLRIQTLIPPPIGRPTMKPASGKFRRTMQRLFRKKPKQYGQRWQVETTISMLNRNLGSALSARNYWTQCGEMTLRVLTHNLMVAA